MIRNIEPTMNDVNELLGESFGGDIKGNCMYASHTFGFEEGKRGYVTNPQDLGLIVKNGLFGKREIGCFIRPDGSALTLYGKGLFGRNIRGARMYAALYGIRFGEEVKIQINGEDQLF
jgi:hypothetical protein|tara:strand:- start:2138 stop:2491 length:354 start_codon:yes stop_codon:yes gene_type:complete